MKSILSKKESYFNLIIGVKNNLPDPKSIISKNGKKAR